MGPLEPVASDGAAFEVLRAPAGGPPATPFVFASPHSGRHYPQTLMQASVLGPLDIRRSEDAYVDRLIAAGPRHGAAVLLARFARAFVDLNREAWELDPTMFSDELPAFARRRTPRVAAGLGSIARVVADGQEIYGRKLTFAEAEARIDSVWRPYHGALQSLLGEAKAAHGVCVLVDWHSMPSAAADAGRGRAVADFVLGDRFGAACAPGLTARVEGQLQAMGYRVARNAPYAGGYVTEFYGRPAEGAHALQVEINRALYLTEGSMEPHDGFDDLATNLDRLIAALTNDWRGCL